MLVRLMVYRLLPVAILGFCRNKKNLKLTAFVTLTGCLLCFLAAVWKIFQQQQWWGLVVLPLAMFPHAICYLFAIWIILRCIWNTWSERVWKRIFYLSIFSIFVGVLLEIYVNSYILQLFLKNFG